MKAINIHGKASQQATKEICLGNSFRKLFDSVREAQHFVADTNRFLTECIVILNLTYTEAFTQYRALWLVATNTKNGNRTNYIDVQHKIKSNLQSADDQFEKFNNARMGSNDPFFAFIDIKKACLFLSEALAHMENTNRKRNLTAAMYACMVLRKRCEIIKQQLEKYPNL